MIIKVPDLTDIYIGLSKLTKHFCESGFLFLLGRDIHSFLHLTNILLSTSYVPGIDPGAGKKTARLHQDLYPGSIHTSHTPWSPH